MNQPPVPQYSAPQKVCPHCGAVAQTLDKKCPNCGKGYKKRTALKVLTGMALFGLVFIVGCAALIGSAAEEVDKELDRQQDASAISESQFDALKMGTRQSTVERRFGEPLDSQEMETEIAELDVSSNMSCIYYNREGGEFGDTFQLCFDDGKLSSKNSY